VCITSRPKVDIKDVLEPLACCAVSLQDECGQQKDISDYITKVVHLDKKMQRWRGDQKNIEERSLSMGFAFYNSRKTKLVLFPFLAMN